MMVTSSDGDYIRSVAPNATLAVGTTIGTVTAGYGDTATALDLKTMTTVPYNQTFGFAEAATVAGDLLAVLDTADPRAPPTTFIDNATLIGDPDASGDTLVEYFPTPATKSYSSVEVDGEPYLIISGYNEFDVFSLGGPEVQHVSSVTIDTSFCDSWVNVLYAMNGNYVYVSSVFRSAVSDDCPGLDGYGTYPIMIFDFSDPTNVSLAGYFSVPSLEEYNGVRIIFGDDDTALLVMQSSGLQFWDFADPLDPKPISPVGDYDWFASFGGAKISVPDTLGFQAGFSNNLEPFELFPPAAYIAKDNTWIVSGTGDGVNGVLYHIEPTSIIGRTNLTEASGGN